MAQTLFEALAEAYMTNPDLQSERANLRQTDEGLSTALSGWRPTVTLTGSLGAEWTDRRGIQNGPDQLVPSSHTVIVEQPVFQGFETVSRVKQAKHDIQSGRAFLNSLEQDVLLASVTAYMDVVRDAAIVELNMQEERALRRQLEAAEDRFAVGEVTRTDVEQSRSRLALSSGERQESEGTLAASKATFVEVIGLEPVNLSTPDLDIQLPGTVDEAIALSVEDNPDIISARFDELSAIEGVDIARSELLPEVALVATAETTREFGGIASQKTDQYSLIGEFTVPIYTAGAASSGVRAAKQAAGEARIEIETERRAAIQETVEAWNDLISARAQIRSFEIQVDAAELALEGVEQEAQVGSRTVLDILDQETELKDAQVNLVRAQRDEVVAIYFLLNAMGQLTAEQIGLPVEYYDATVYTDAIDERLFGLKAYPEDLAGPKRSPQEIGRVPTTDGPLPDFFGPFPRTPKE